MKPKIEVLDGFKSLPTSKENEMLNKSKFDPFPDFDIPGELELCDDGFRQIKPPRKSNRWKLQEFNQIKPENEENVPEAQTAGKQMEIINVTSAKNNLNAETEKPKPRVMTRSKIASSRRNENCAQQ